MELRDLRYFATLAEELHFRRAAERLQLAQPTLSRQIRLLEEELKVSLLIRTKRRVLLTDAGRVFLEYARRLLAEAEKAVRMVQLVSRGEIGELTIGCNPAAEITLLPRVLPVFQKRFPKVNVTIESLSTATQPQALRDRRIDVGFIRLPCEDTALLVIECVGREPLVVVLPENHSLAARRRIPLKALAGQPYIAIPRRLAPGYYDALISLCRSVGFSPNVVKEADHFHSQLSLTALGFGVSLQPMSIVRSLRTPGLTIRPLMPPVPQAEIGMVYRRDDNSELLRGFTSVVRESITGRERRRGGLGA